MRNNRTSHRKSNYLQALPCDENMNTGRNSKQTTCLCRDTEGIGTLPAVSWCLMSSDVSWHIRDKLWHNAEARFNNSLCPRKPEGSLGRTAQDVHLDSHTAPELLFFPVLFLFDWVGVLWPQLSKVLKPVHWAGSIPFPPVSLQRQVGCLLLRPVFMCSSQGRACK